MNTLKKYFFGICVLAVLLCVRDVCGFVSDVWQKHVRESGKTPPAAAVAFDGEYDGKAEVAAYLRKFGGRLPKNYITKAQARSLGWQGGPLEPFAPGKCIGGDRFGNYEKRLPDGVWMECDIGTRGRSRGAKRLVFAPDGRTIYYTGDHYGTFESVEGNGP
jgi:hypothetical protein